MSVLSSLDPEISEAIGLELGRQREKLELIASENITSPAVLEAVGSILTNKYAEGYPGHRHYGGCEFVDQVENLARDRAKKLFGCEWANVQPHAGSQANMAVLFTILKPGEKLLGMDLAHGGHLTHGASASFSGKFFDVSHYGVSRETEMLDYDEIARIARETKPKLIIAGASAYSRIIDFKAFRRIADEVGALLMVDMAHIAGLVATGLHPTPVYEADFVTSTTHKTLRGPRGGLILIGKEKENTLGIKAAKSGRTRTFGELIDSMVMPGIQGGPLMHVIAGKAVAFKEAMTPEFAEYQARVLKNAKRLCAALKTGGARIVSGGTDNHMMLIDVTPFGLTGKEAELALDAANITANKNGIPFDTKGPLITSGIRLGSPALTTRGMGEAEMGEVSALILEVLRSKGDETVAARVKGEVLKLCSRFPIYN
jgi:glycine hydroxymethyltransferase